MHAGFPCFSPQLQKVVKLGANTRDDSGEFPIILDKVGGRLVASGMAVLVKLGFGVLLRNGLLDEKQSKKAGEFFEENFVITDPQAPGGKRYYQGKFLIRTRKRKDDMNVYLKFCPDPDDLYCKTPFGEALNPFAVVGTETLSEKVAQQIENDPDKVDLVINFKDVESILGLIGREEVDIVGLLLENLVQLKGNVGHLFKLGAIGSNIELELGLLKPH
jgi:hypothetical protein